MRIIPFSNERMNDVRTAFNGAFSDYRVNFQFQPRDFKIRLHNKLNIDPDLSCLALYEEAVIGFALHSQNTYQGDHVVYNGGTGIIPEMRRRGVASLLLEQCGENFKNRGFRTWLLEAIETNNAAIRLYDQMGFYPQQRLLCFKRIHPVPGQSSQKGLDYAIQESSDWSFDELKSLDDFETSFIDSWEQIKRDHSKETLLEARSGAELIGYLVFQAHLGRISRLAVKKSHRQKRVATHLLAKCDQLCPGKALTLMNIPEKEEGMKLFLEKTGFQHQITQVEMVRYL